MDNNSLIFIGIGVIVVAVFGYGIFFLFNKSSRINNDDEYENEEANLSGLDLMLYKLSQKQTTAQEIEQMVEEFLSTQHFTKRADTYDEHTKKQLNFVKKISSHLNSTPKMIARLNVELKKLYPEYSSDIEMHEALGLMNRR